jgi:hypothetical protein
MLSDYDNRKKNFLLDQTKNLIIINDSTADYRYLVFEDNKIQKVSIKKLFILGVYDSSRKMWLSGWYIFDSKDSRMTFKSVMHIYNLRRNTDFEKIRKFKQILLTPYMKNANKLICDSYVSIYYYFLNLSKVIVFSPTTHNIKIKNVDDNSEINFTNKNITFYCGIFDEEEYKLIKS